MSAPTSDSAPGSAPTALARAVVELEEYVSQRGWDAPVRVFALVRTARALREDPSLAELLDDGAVEAARRDPETLTVVEQEGLPAAADLEDLLAQLAWPDSVDGVAMSVERMMLPAGEEREAAAIADPEERAAYLGTRTDAVDLRIVAGVLRDGGSWCAIRSRAADAPDGVGSIGDVDGVVSGQALVPDLVEALRATLE